MFILPGKKQLCLIGSFGDAPSVSTTCPGSWEMPRHSQNLTGRLCLYFHVESLQNTKGARMMDSRSVENCPQMRRKTRVLSEMWRRLKDGDRWDLTVQLGRFSPAGRFSWAYVLGLKGVKHQLKILLVFFFNNKNNNEGRSYNPVLVNICHVEMDGRPSWALSSDSGVDTRSRFLRNPPIFKCWHGINF